MSIYPHQREANDCLAWSEAISDWERDFLIDISAQRTLSPKQKEKLAAILTKVRLFRSTCGYGCEF